MNRIVPFTSIKDALYFAFIELEAGNVVTLMPINHQNYVAAGVSEEGHVASPSGVEVRNTETTD